MQEYENSYLIRFFLPFHPNFVDWSTLIYTLLSTSDKNEGDTALAGWSSSLASQHLLDRMLSQEGEAKTFQGEGTSVTM